MSHEKKDQSKVVGGLARADALSAEQRTEIARGAALARWSGDLPRATHEGVLRLSGIEIPCSVLEDGTRLLSQVGLFRAIGRRGQAKGVERETPDSRLPEFLAADNLKTFITNDLIATSVPIPFRTKSGAGRNRQAPMRALGYRAEILPLICNVLLDAKESGALFKSQLHIAERCKILSRGFAVVGVSALIDEATGYQEVRDRLALQKILDAYLSRELAAWAKRFPDEFYKQLFRLRGWTWDDLKKGRGQGGRVVGKYTNDLVYSRLAPGILEELQIRNPTDENGRRRARHHQWLSEDVGHSALAQHLHAVTGFLRASDTWEQFLRLVNKAFPRRTDLKDLPLFSSQVTASIEQPPHAVQSLPAPMKSAS